MKTHFLNRLFNDFRRDVAGAITEIYVNRSIAGLTPEQEFDLSVLKDLATRIDRTGHLFLCCKFLQDILDDDVIADHISLMLEESPRVERWNLLKVLAPLCAEFIEDFMLEKKAA